MRPDGSGVRRVARFPEGGAGGFGPSWSGDGRWLAFVTGGARSGPPGDRLLVARADGSDPRPVEMGVRPGERILAPILSPDGRRVMAVVGPGSRPFLRLVVADRRTGDARAARARAITADADWSPDGETVVFSGVTEAGDRRYHLYAVPAEDGERRRLAGERPAARHPRHSPDGSSSRTPTSGATCCRRTWRPRTGARSPTADENAELFGIAAEAISASPRRSSTGCTRRPGIVGGIRLFPARRAGAVLRAWRDLMADAPDASRGRGPHRASEPFVPADLWGRTAFGLVGAGSGPPRRPRRQGRRCGRGPAADLVGPMSDTALQGLIDPDAARAAQLLEVGAHGRAAGSGDRRRSGARRRRAVAAHAVILEPKGAIARPPRNCGPGGHDRHARGEALGRDANIAWAARDDGALLPSRARRGAELRRGRGAGPIRSTGPEARAPRPGRVGPQRPPLQPEHPPEPAR